eukprot:1162456-Rhodomonas_salina.1
MKDVRRAAGVCALPPSCSDRRLSPSQSRFQTALATATAHVTPLDPRPLCHVVFERQHGPPSNQRQNAGSDLST